ncbi:hypothetical protein HID58_074035, partial [Brassica napus]
MSSIRFFSPIDSTYINSPESKSSLVAFIDENTVRFSSPKASDKSSTKAPAISTTASMAKNPVKSPPKLQVNRPLNRVSRYKHFLKRGSHSASLTSYLNFFWTLSRSYPFFMSRVLRLSSTGSGSIHPKRLKRVVFLKAIS